MKGFDQWGFLLVDKQDILAVSDTWQTAVFSWYTHIWGHFLIRVKEILISKSYLHFEMHLIRPAAACRHERWYADVQPAQEWVLRMVFGKPEGIKRLVISYGMPWWRQIKSLKEPPRSLGKCPYTELVKRPGWFSRITPSKMLQFISPVIPFKPKTGSTDYLHFYISLYLILSSNIASVKHYYIFYFTCVSPFLYFSSLKGRNLTHLISLMLRPGLGSQMH